MFRRERDQLVLAEHEETVAVLTKIPAKLCRQVRKAVGSLLGNTGTHDCGTVLATDAVCRHANPVRGMFVPDVGQFFPHR